MLIRRFLHWWGRELAALVPVTVRRAARSQQPTLRFELTEEEIRVQQKLNGSIEEIGLLERHKVRQESGGSVFTETISRRLSRFSVQRMQVIVVVAPGLGLSKDLELPLAVEENLEQTLSFQIERETPFRREDVYFNYRVLSRDTGEKRIRLQLYVVPRQIVDEALGLIRSWEVQPAVESNAGDHGQWLALYFLPSGYRRSGANRLHLALIILNCILLTSLVAVTYIQQGRVLRELQDKLANARVTAQKAEVLQQRIDSIEAEREFLMQQKRSHPAVVKVLEELSVVLSETTWLNQLEVKGNEIHLQGVSDSSSSLINPIESSSLFQDTRLGASMTQNSNDGQEHFRLSAGVAAEDGNNEAQK